MDALAALSVSDALFALGGLWAQRSPTDAPERRFKLVRGELLSCNNLLFQYSNFRLRIPLEAHMVDALIAVSLALSLFIIAAAVLPQDRARLALVSRVMSWLTLGAAIALPLAVVATYFAPRAMAPTSPSLRNRRYPIRSYLAPSMTLPKRCGPQADRRSR